MPKIKSILVSQPKPEGKSPYFDLAEKHKIKVDFRSFIHVEGISARDFRQERIDFNEIGAVIFTSRNAADYFFKMAEELRFEDIEKLKYFCTSEATALYLQKYIPYRKRKIFFGDKTIQSLMPHIIKHKKEKYFLPTSNIHNNSIPEILKKDKINFETAVLYKTVASDLSDLANIKYDMLVFFSPQGIESLYKNFPDFEQGLTKIAVWGKTTEKAVLNAGLRIDLQAPMPKIPSMTMAIESYIKQK